MFIDFCFEFGNIFLCVYLRFLLALRKYWRLRHCYICLSVFFLCNLKVTKFNEIEIGQKINVVNISIYNAGMLHRKNKILYRVLKALFCFLTLFVVNVEVIAIIGAGTLKQ